jgi:hypothetical protein
MTHLLPLRGILPRTRFRRQDAIVSRLNAPERELDP